MSNRSKTELLAELRMFLNEETRGFWADDQLKAYLKKAFLKYYRDFMKFMPEQAKKTTDVTYTAGSSYVDVSTSGYVIDILDVVEDRTTYQPGPHLVKANSLQEILDEQNSAVNAGVDAEPKWYMEKNESNAGGVLTIKQRLYLSNTDAARSLRLHFQGVLDFSADDHTTGVPDYAEDCIIFQAAVYAEAQRGRPGFGGFPQLLAEAVSKMKEQMIPLSAGPKRIEYVDYDD